MPHPLRDYQERAVEIGYSSLAPGSRCLIASPTGSGKSYMQLALRDKVPGSVIVSPSPEILRGYEEKAGSSEGLYTYVKLRNLLIDGMNPPSLIICDESHMATDTTSLTVGDIVAVCPEVPLVGFTASPFRGTPKGTQALREFWGDPHVVLNVAEAVKRGFWQMPELSIVPLLDDDQLVISNGEFSIQSVNDGTQSRLESLIKTIRDHRNGPTVVNLPSTECVRALQMIMGDEVAAIVQDTPDKERQEAYERCRTNQSVLLQIRAISVGVDLPWLQTMIDARPTLSPVLFLQTFGRLTRPFDAVKRYVCCNRNLERFAYLLDGLCPLSVVGESQAAFGGMSVRAASKTLGLEAVGRFKPIPVPLANGVNAAMYALQTLTNERKLKEYILLCLPNFQRPIIFSRLSGQAKWNEETAVPERAWGKWGIEKELPDDFCGYKTSPQKGNLSDKQIAWWEKAAAHRGLDPTAAPDLERRQFCILPALMNAGLSLKPLLVEEK